MLRTISTSAPCTSTGPAKLSATEVNSKRGPPDRRSQYSRRSISANTTAAVAIDRRNSRRYTVHASASTDLTPTSTGAAVGAGVESLTAGSDREPSDSEVRQTPAEPVPAAATVRAPEDSLPEPTRVGHGVGRSRVHVLRGLRIDDERLDEDVERPASP